MSSNTMLKQAIIDANALREVALKNAESIVVEKYSNQIKEAVDIMLEQDEDLGGLDMGVTVATLAPSGIESQVPYAATEGEPLCPCPDSGQTIRVDFDDLQQMMADLEDAEEDGGGPLPEPTPDEVLPPEEEDDELGSLQEDEDVEFDLSDLIAELQDPDETDTMGMPKNAGEEEGDELAAEEDPKKVDVTEDTTYSRDDDYDERHIALQESKKKALKENNTLTKKNSKIMRENKSLHEKGKTLLTENKTLLTENKEMRVLLEKLSITLEESNLSNGKLVYTNRVLTSNSLNERQKKRIVEAINGADSVEAAKSIYETLQSAVGSSLHSESGPKSLGEAVTRGSATMLRQKQKQRKQDPFMHRMKKLAGI